MLIGVAVLVFGRMDKTVEGFGIVRPARFEHVRAQVEGTIKDVFVEEGDSVRAGDTVAIITADKLILAVDQSKKALEQAQADLTQLKEEHQNLVLSASFETQSAFANLYQARYRAETARKKYERAQTLYERDLISQEERDEKELEYELAQSYHVALKERAELLEKRFLLQIQKQKHEVELAAIEYEYAKADLGKSYVISPMTGQILTPNTAELVGQKVSVGQPVMEIGDLTEMDFVARISESEIPGVSAGQETRIFINAFPHHKYRVFRGMVQHVPATPKLTDRGIFFEVMIEIADPRVEAFSPAVFLKPGLSGEAEIILEKDVRLIELILGSKQN